MDSCWASSVGSSHFRVKLTNSSVKGSVSELFVHIVESSATLILQDDAVGSDSSGILFEDFANKTKMVKKSSQDPQD